jgi:hypothetical protein
VSPAANSQRDAAFVQPHVPRSSFAAYVQLQTAGDATIYEGEALYRPAKPHPATSAPEPTIGIPDAAMATRPAPDQAYRIWFNGDRIAITAIYLERVASCWWFVLDRPPRHPPSI